MDVVVEDKNWENIRQVEAEGLAVAENEDLPFREYVSTLTYELKDCATGKIVASAATYPVLHDGKSEILTFPEELPFGKYELTLWGNLDPDSKAAGIANTVTLHTDCGGEAGDIYHYTAVIDYDHDKAAYTAGLKRTVGCLLIDAVNLPQGMDYSEKAIDGVMSTVEKGFVYSVPVSVFTSLEWPQDDNKIRTSTCLGPSPSENGTEVTVKFRDRDVITGAGTQYEIAADPVDITVERNRLTVLKYDYDKDGFHISVLVNDRWETLHGMIVD